MGKGLGTSIIPLFAGIHKDLEALRKRFVLAGRPNYDEFYFAFKDMNMHLVYSGRDTLAELAEFSERLLQIAANYMHEHYDPEMIAREPHLKGGKFISRPIVDRIYGAYLTFALYASQSTKSTFPVRVSPMLLDAVTNLFAYARDEKLYDVMECIRRLKEKEVFRVVPFSKYMFGPAELRRYDMDYEQLDNPDAFHVTPFTNMHKFMKRPDTVKLLSTLQGKEIRGVNYAEKIIAIVDKAVVDMNKLKLEPDQPIQRLRSPDHYPPTKRIMLNNFRFDRNDNETAAGSRPPTELEDFLQYCTTPTPRPPVARRLF
ncbi:unnamed protein product, partial [Mesorhabditis spiculigera]